MCAAHRRTRRVDLPPVDRRFVSAGGSPCGMAAAALIVAILLAVLSLPVTSGLVSISVPAYALMAVAFLVLLLGNLIRGL